MKNNHFTAVPLSKEIIEILNKVIDDFNCKWKSHEEKNFGIQSYSIKILSLLENQNIEGKTARQVLENYNNVEWLGGEPLYSYNQVIDAMETFASQLLAQETGYSEEASLRSRVHVLEKSIQSALDILPLWQAKYNSDEAHQSENDALLSMEIEFKSLLSKNASPFQLPASQEGEKWPTDAAFYQPLFNLLSNQYDIMLTESEMDDIINCVQKMAPSPLPVSPQNIQEVSDEEIKDAAFNFVITDRDINDSTLLIHIHNSGFIDGAKWMRDKMMGYKQEDKWISVDERTPEHKELVIGINKNGIPSPAIFYDNRSFSGFYPFTNFYLNEDKTDNYYSNVNLDIQLEGIIKWMPIVLP